MQYDQETVCHLCRKEIENRSDKVRNHDHLTGQFLEAAHKQSNLNYRMRFNTIQIPCFIHNLSAYNADFIVTAAKGKHGKASVIPNNIEKFVSFSIGSVTFKDSYAFTQSSLAVLVSNLDDNQLISTCQYLEQSVYKNRVDEDDVRGDMLLSNDGNGDDGDGDDGDDDEEEGSGADDGFYPEFNGATEEEYGEEGQVMNRYYYDAETDYETIHMNDPSCVRRAARSGEVYETFTS